MIKVINLTKKEVQRRVLKDGKPLALSLFTWDKKKHIFSSKESGLMIDFGFISFCNFKTGPSCTFKTWLGCTFETGSDCVFNTNHHCTFKTGPDCVFKTWSYCTFKTGDGCVVVRRDVYEVIELKKGQKIRLNDFGIKGFVVLSK